MTELELEVTGYANGGSGIARSNGRVVFVEGGLPGRQRAGRQLGGVRADHRTRLIEPGLKTIGREVKRTSGQPREYRIGAGVQSIPHLRQTTGHLGGDQTQAPDHDGDHQQDDAQCRQRAWENHRDLVDERPQHRRQEHGNRQRRDDHGQTPHRLDDEPTPPRR